MANSSNFTVANHYVPQWYQKRFLESNSDATTLFLLDKTPDKILLPNGGVKFKKSIYEQGPKKCFKEDHLYTLLFGEFATDVIEKNFFGVIDSLGCEAVQFFENYSVRDGVHEAFSAMLNYLAAQLFRTPKGLKLIRVLARAPNHQRALYALLDSWELYKTIWQEGVWEVFHCKGSQTKFIISDGPVATYNKQIFPGSQEVNRFGLALFERVGTHLLFPLGPEHCLCVTNLQYVRKPKVNPTKFRENPRYFGQGLFDLRKIQRGREISETEVIAINHILKTNAMRYVASSREEWLYPEAHLTEQFWSKLGGAYFLHPDPRKVSFTTAIISGGGKGPSLGTNEYGHYDIDNKKAKKLRENEWHTFQKAKSAWDERDRKAGRAPPAFDPEYF